MRRLLERFKLPTSAAPAKALTLDGMVAKSGSREAWWLLKKSSKLAVKRPDPSPPKDGYYISFSPQDDISARLDKPRGAIIKDMMGDIGEDLFSLKMSERSLGKTGESSLVNNLRASWLYACPKSRIESLPSGVRLISGIAAMRGLLARNRAVENMQTPFVAGMYFEGKSDVNVLVLMVCQEDGTLENIDYIPLGDVEPSSAIRTYVQTVRLSSSGDWTQERTAIFSSKDLALLALRPYPNEIEFGGIGVSKLWKMGAAISGAALIATSVAAGGLYMKNASIKNEVSRLNAEVNQIKEQTKTFIATQGLGQIILKRSIDVPKAIDRASNVWIENSLVTIKATPENVRLIVQARLKEPEIATKALMSKPPEGCQKMEASASTQITQMVLNYECQISDPDFQRISRTLQ